MIKRRSLFFFNCEVVEVAASNDLVSSIVGVAAPREGLVSPSSSSENLLWLAI